MATLKRDSLVWRLLILLGGAFAVTALLVFLLVNTLVGRVLNQRAIEVYGQRAEAIVNELHRQTERLALTGQVEVYRADFQDAALRNLTDLHYRQANPEIFPFIVGGNGAIQMHPWYPQGDLTYFDQITSLNEFGHLDGEFTDIGRDGDEQLVVVRYHEPWNWYVAYSVPLEVVTADGRKIEIQLLLAWAVATLAVLLALAWLLTRETRPLLSLASAAEAMARGDLDAEVDEERPGEVGVLARGFVHMRGAIRRQISELRESESRYRKIFDAGTDGLLLLDHDGNIVAANPAAGGIYGWSPQQLVGRSVTTLLRDGDEELAQALRQPPADQPVRLQGFTCKRGGGELETAISAVRLTFQSRSHALIILRDITQQQHLERQLLQSQKLESVGRLAGGIAHDFNNLLTPVLGYTEMLLDDVELSDNARGDVSAIRRAGERARGLARQLLAFSRRQVLEMRNLDLGEVLEEISPILRRTLREDIELEIVGGAASCRAQADRGQFEQIIMNLAVNAMDAMPDGGRVEIRTTCVNVKVGDKTIALDPAAGNYVRLTVRDSGHGIPEEIIDRVFEPFFTTKEAGKGTGLGLATIHGIVTQHKGYVGLRNHPEGGCEVEILLPCLPAKIELDVLPEMSDPDAPIGRDELVWLVEDDAMVRDLVVSLLQRKNFKVHAFAAGSECLEHADGDAPLADIVLTDVVMPGMSGPDLRDQLRQRGHDMPVLFMSGYTGETLTRRGLADAHADFILKPLEPALLFHKLRHMLDEERPDDA